MADIPSAGGGKIRSRRAASSRKPYSRAGSQQKSLFSRMTDSVKTLLNPITPKWLTNRLNHSDNVKKESWVQGQSFTNAPSTSSNHQAQQIHANNNYKRSPLSRPPLSTGPSSSSSLQYYITPPDTPQAEEVEKTSTGGKQGLLKHLAMSSKRAKMSQDLTPKSDESTLRNEMKYLTANDNASVASSSGCSSSMQASQRTNNSADLEGSQRNLWSSSMDSLASSKTSSKQQPTMTSHKHPRFNPAVFGIPAMGSPSRTPDVLQSSFYNGPIQYGGANASTRLPYFATPYKVPSVTKVKVRRVNHHHTPGSSGVSSESSKSSLDESSAAGMSSTARKILQTLERMSSPLNDARKIPSSVSRTPSSFMVERQRRRTIGSSSMQAPPTMGLATPSSARIRRSVKIPLNNSLLLRNAKKISIDTSMEIKQIGSSPTTSAPDSTLISTRGVPAPIASMSSTEAMPKTQMQSFVIEPSGGGGKMKSQRRTTSHYSAMHEEQEEETPDLPAIALPLACTSHLPSFNFGKSGMTSTPTIRPQSKKQLMNPSQLEFNFASPVVKANNSEQAQTTDNTPKFQFSSPPTKSTSTSNELGTALDCPSSNFNAGSKSSTQSLVFAPDPKVVSAVRQSKRKSSPSSAASHISVEGGFQSDEKLKVGSVMDILRGEKNKVSNSKSDRATSNTTSSLDSQFKPLTQIKSGWECGTCLVENDSGVDICVACQAPKPSATVNTNTLKITQSKSGWDCDTCMVPNDPGTEKCVACETPRPGSTAAKTPSTFGSSLFGGNSKLPSKSDFAFGIPATDSKNTNAWDKSLMKPPGDWECGSCFVSNDSSANICEACQTVRTGPASNLTQKTSKPTEIKFGLQSSTTPQSAKKTEFKFGIPKSSSSKDDSKQSGWGSQFKKATSTWECEMCMVTNPLDSKTCEACESPKPGTEKKDLNSSFKFGEASSGLFKFGLPNAKSEKLQPVGKEDVAFGHQGKATKVMFGAPHTSAQSESSSNTIPTFTFGAPSESSVISSNSEARKEETSKSAPTFSFGVKPKLNEEESSNIVQDKKPQGLFSFGGLKKVEGKAENKKISTIGPAGFNAPTSSAQTSVPQFTGFGSTITSSSPPSTSDIKSMFGTTAPGTQSVAPSFPAAPALSHSTASAAVEGATFGGFKTSTSEPIKKPEEKKPEVSSFSFGASNSVSGQGGMFQFSGANTTASTQSTTASAPTFSGFSFGSKPTEESKTPNTGFSFGSQPKTAASNVAMFGAGTSATPTEVSSADQTPFGGFSSNSQSIASNQPHQNSSTSTFKGFNFGTSQQTTQPNSGQVFGAGNAANNATPFGTTNSNPTPFGMTSANPTPFGATGQTSQTGGVFGAAGSSVPAFGDPAANKPSAGLPKPSFAFGATPNNQSTEQKPSGGAFPGFQFNSSNDLSANNRTQTGSGFNFGTPTNKPQAFNATPSSGFQFGAAAPQQQQSNGIFQFGSSSAQQSKPAVASDNKSGMFVFGENNPNNATAPQHQPSTGFSFGASSVPGGFNFSGNQPAAPQGGGGAMFSMGEAAPNQNPFSATSSRSTTPVPGRRVIRQARRKLRK